MHLQGNRRWVSLIWKVKRSLKIAQVTYFENALRSRRFIYPNFFFPSMFSLSDNVSPYYSFLVKAMYQSAFLGFELSQYTVVVITIWKVQN